MQWWLMINGGIVFLFENFAKFVVVLSHYFRNPDCISEPYSEKVFQSHIKIPV